MITYIGNNRPEGKSFQNVFIIVSHKGVDYPVTVSALAEIPDEDIKLYAEGNRRYKIDFFKTLYPSVAGHSLQAIEQWISGHPEVRPLHWASTHPKEVSEDYKDALSSYRNSPLYNKTQMQIDSYIDTMDTIPKFQAGLKEITRALKILMYNIDNN